MKLIKIPSVQSEEPLKPPKPTAPRWLQKAVKAAALATTLLAPQVASAHEGHSHTPPPNIERISSFSYQMQGNFNLHTGCRTFQPLLAVQGQQSDSEFRHRLEHDNCLDIHGYVAYRRNIFGIYLNDGAIQAAVDNYVIAHAALEFSILSLPAFSLKLGPGFGLEYRLTGENSYTVIHIGLHGEANSETVSVQFEFVPEIIQGTQMPIHEAKLAVIFAFIQDRFALGLEIYRHTNHPSNDRDLSIPEHLAVNSLNFPGEIRIGSGNFCVSTNAGVSLSGIHGFNLGIGFGQCSDLLAPHDHGYSHLHHHTERSPQPSHGAHCHTHRDGTVHCGSH
jgi:hypothetical protein